MEFSLPQIVLSVESHLLWIGEVIPYLERSMIDRSLTMKDHIRSLDKCDDQDNSNEGDLASVTDENYADYYNPDNPKYCNIYASRLNEAALLAYLGDYSEALERLELLRRIYETLPPSQRPAFEYAVDALTWAVKTLNNLTIPQSDQDSSLDPLQEPSAFWNRWRDVQKDDKCKAVFRYLWGCLGATLKISEECLLPIFQETVTLDPDYHVWYSIVYQTMRGVRRNLLRQQSGHLDAPSEQEMIMCKMAFERAPHIYLSVKDMAVMIKEMLWMREEKEWDLEQETYLLCQQLFQKALRIATDRGQKEWKCKIQVYFAEYLLFGRGRLLDQAEGKRLLDECLHENPEKTTVLHKAGKLCHYGAAAKGPKRERKYRCLDLGARMYKAALKAKPTNYPCVKDYLKLLKAQGNYLTYVEVCEEAIPVAKRDYQVSDLTMLKGCVLWVFNPRNTTTNRQEACESWLYVFSKLPAFSDILLSRLKAPPFNIGCSRKKAQIKIKNVITNLHWMKRQSAESDRKEIILRFIQELKTL